MSARGQRIAWRVTAASAVVASLLLLLDRQDRVWPVPPTTPYVDSTYDHWLYKTLGALARPGDSLGVWGWAAHLWVYSGLLPATRESSTEFAMLDWGPESYYRRRYMDALTGRPPPFFVEAVGSQQFLFTDRAKQGLDSLPGLRGFVAANYEPLFDDGETGLYLRRDLAAGCCTRVPTGRWRDGGGVTRPLQHIDNLSEINRGGWSISDAVDAGATARLSMPLSSTRTFDGLLLPMIVGPHGDRAGFHLGIADPQGTTRPEPACDAVIQHAAAMKITLCVLRFPPTTATQLVFTDGQSAQGAWVALGRPVLLHHVDARR